MKGCKTCKFNRKRVAEVVPLKQGLKLKDDKLKLKTKTGCRGSSIKTRIET